MRLELFISTRFNTLRPPLCSRKFGCWLALLVCVSSASGQEMASLSGTVTDQSGATISGATVRVKSVETGVPRGTIADSEGRYQFSSLSVGEYEVRVAKPGFSEGVHTGVHMVVGQSAIVNIELQVGEASLQVSVS